MYKNRWYIKFAPVFCKNCSRDAGTTCTSILNLTAHNKINVSPSPWQFVPLNQLRHGRALLRNCPISVAVLRKSLIYRKSDNSFVLMRKV